MSPICWYLRFDRGHPKLQISGFFPARVKICGAQQRPLVEMSQTRRTKNRWPHQTATMKNRKVAHPLAARRAGEVALRLGRSCRNGGRYDARCLPVRLAPARLGVRLAKSVPDTRDVICKAASCAGVRSAEPPAHGKGSVNGIVIFNCFRLLLREGVS